ncbi:glycosyltransferase family 20-domain-containing protein [Pilaira anomala]|nr:glycosyltransferase family 20-domain-containing protein [Pilaira anomala]
MTRSLEIEKKGRLINVTHQIPYEINSDDTGEWEFTPRRGHGAMYGGIHSLQNTWELVHIGWTGLISKNNVVIEEDLPQSDKDELYSILKEKHSCLPLFVDSETVSGHYDGYCKTMLWPLLHYIIWNDATDGRVESTQWEAYKAVNQQYADFVSELYQDGDIIWVHDYHLLLVPSMIRAKHPEARIGLFIHSPFPTSEIFRCLPKRQEILIGMIGANLVGFQTYAYARHFISTCTRVLGYESTPDGLRCLDGYFCHVGTFPIGIDPEEIEARCNDPTVQSKSQALKELYAGKKIVVGRDKIDLVKGVLQKLAAFEKFLTDFPEWRNNVVLIQLTDGATNESAKLEHKVSETVAHINNTFGSLEFTPVHHFHHQIQLDEHYALLSTADCAVITANRDGMNTTSLEYIVCQEGENKHGPLILSELTGTAGSLSSSLMVNPWDYAGVAKAINDALVMSEEEKISRHMQMLAHVKTHTASFWAKSFVKVLEKSIAASEQSSYTPLLEIEPLLNNYRQTKKRLLCFDYDGTLSEVRRFPGSSAPKSSMISALQLLCDDPNNAVWVVSGRDEATLDKWLGHVRGIGLSAEHGSFVKYPGSSKWINLLEHFDMGWKNDVVEIFSYYAERTTGSFIEHKRCSVTWHYSLADPEYGAFQSKECQNHLEHAILSKLPVEVLVGKKKLEVRPTTTNKGEIIKRLLAANEDIDFIMCCGDDRTDEAMFKALKNVVDPSLPVFSIVVGAKDKKTLATWRIASVQDVLGALTALTNN